MYVAGLDEVEDVLDLVEVEEVLDLVVEVVRVDDDNELVVGWDEVELVD